MGQGTYTNSGVFIRPLVEKEFSYAVSRLAELESLVPGWLDGEGSAIADLAIRAALDLLEELVELYVPLPRIYPTPAGGVQFEWSESALHVEVRLTGHGHEVFAAYTDSNEDTINKPEVSLSQVVAELLGRPA